jgi:pimeloyl-ACP methyl ester carboxylesterase
MADSAGAARAPSDIKHGDVTVSDGVRIHYMEAGKGVPVVLLHGYTSSSEGSWFSDGIAEALARTNRVIGIDARGHGLSEKPHDPAKYDGDRMPQDVIEVLDTLGVKKAHFHGYSMGGGLVAHLLARWPERFITAGFGGSGVRETDEALAAKAKEMDPKGQDPQQEEARRKLQTRGGRDQVALDAVSAGRRAKPGTAPPLDLTKIDFPVLAVNGEFDAPYSKTQRLQREVKTFKAVILPGKAHNTAIMAGYIPQLYIDTMVEFITKNDPK